MQLVDAARAHVAPIQATLTQGMFRPDLPPTQRNLLFKECVLRLMLPERYALTLGAVLAGDTLLPDAGLLIYDAQHGLPLGDVLPVETVYALCDISATIDADGFEQRLLTIEKFKQLKRDVATAYDVSPLHHLHMFGARYAQLSDSKLNPLLGYMVVGDAGSPETLHERLNELVRAGKVSADGTPDAVFSLNGGWLIARQTRLGELAVPRSTFAKFGIYEVGNDVLTWMYLLLNASLAQIQLRGPDLMRALAHLARK